MSPKEFRADLRKTKQILESITGEPVRGYRAANCSIVKKTIWAQEVLIEEGFYYDSSIFPIRHDRYGIPDADRFFHIVQNGQPNGLIEFPLSTVRLFNENFPVAGGGYLRFLPLSFIKWGIKQVNLKEHRPVVLFMHPWEIDPDQPRQPAPFLTRLRHYHNLKYTEQKLRELLGSFQFGPIRDVIGQWESKMERKEFHPIIPDEIEFGRVAQDNVTN
jgi:polysaccharide deacetylase family protein (PEP-CTERM system associated)